MNRREAIGSLLAIAGGSATVRATSTRPASPENNDLFVLEMLPDVDYSADHCEKIHAKWKSLWQKGQAPRLLIVQGAKVSGPLPGKYAVREKIGKVERTVTFQTAEEMQSYINSIWPT